MKAVYGGNEREKKHEKGGTDFPEVKNSRSG
jgi:hypothetical protein